MVLFEDLHLEKLRNTMKMSVRISNNPAEVESRYALNTVKSVAAIPLFCG
jgi:hypothetical protein